MRRRTAGVLLPGFDGTELPAWVQRRLRDGLGGVCLFGSNIESPRQLRALTDAIVTANPDALIAIDEEGGDVTRLYYRTGSPTPGNGWLGHVDDVDLTRASAAAIARQLGDVGCNLNFAPTADVNSNPDNPVIGVRSFGTRPDVVARHTAAWVTGHQGEGVAVSVKHFPGHGDTVVDSHLGLPVVPDDVDQLRRVAVPPFDAAFRAGAWSVMTSHVLLPRVDPDGPATFSRPILQHLLRDDLGFEGLVVSDALDMAGASQDTGIPEAAVRALVGGCDLLCIGSDNTDDQLDEIEAGLVAAIDDGRLGPDRVADAARRVGRLGRMLAERRRRPPELPDRFDDTPAVPLDVVRKGFEMSAAGTELVERLRAAGGPLVVAQLQTKANAAVGVVPWGPGAASPVVRVAEGDAVDDLVSQAAGHPLVVVGRNNHRHAWVTTFLDVLRSRRPDLVVVEMGWPDDSRRYADLATFGGSRLLGQALLEALADPSLGTSLTAR